jgi:toxin FitB
LPAGFCRVGTEIALHFARLRVPVQRHDRDALIAATALVYGLTVVTHNISDFGPMNVAVFNPWEEGQNA